MIIKIMFNLVAFILVLYIFWFKLIKKNDTMYVTVLTMQAIGILINFIQILFNKLNGTTFHIIIYVLSVILPGAILLIELKGKNFSEMVYMTLSKTLIILNRKKKAKEILITLVTKYPNSYYAHKTLAQIYEKEGGMRKAIDEYVKALDIKPNDYNSYFRIAVLLNDLKKKKESIQMLKTLVRKKPEFYEANRMLGYLLIEKENYKEAINIYTEAIKHNQDKDDLYYYLGIAYTKTNDFPLAKQCYEMAIQINSNMYKAYYKLGQIALLYRDIEQAENNFMQAIYEENEAKSYYQLAKIYVIKNDKTKAGIYINRAINLDERIYEKAKKEPVLFPIKQYIVKPQSITIYQKENEKRKEQSKIEKNIEEYLDDTYTLTKEINDKELKVNKINNFKWEN